MADTKNPRKKPGIQITYCDESGFRDKAASLAAAIEKNPAFTVELKEGQGGIFEITLDGKVFYTKCPCRPFPRAAEVIEMAEELIKTRDVSGDARQSDDEADSAETRPYPRG